MQLSPHPPRLRTLCLLSLQMKGALAEIIQLATLDSDPWVLMVADILKSFPDTGSLNLDLEEQNPNVQDILGELREKGICVCFMWGGGKHKLMSTVLRCVLCSCCGSGNVICVNFPPTLAPLSLLSCCPDSSQSQKISL